MRDDILTVRQAQENYGMHKTFDDKTFEEILFKLTVGWYMLGEPMNKISSLKSSETAEVRIVKNREEWSLRHIFGIEPIKLHLLENMEHEFFFNHYTNAKSWNY